MEEEKEDGGSERRSLGGRISEEVQQQARQKESPVVSELLVAARRGLTERVVQLMREDPNNAALTDKVLPVSIVYSLFCFVGKGGGSARSSFYRSSFSCSTDVTVCICLVLLVISELL